MVKFKIAATVSVPVGLSVHKLICQGNVEERILPLQAKRSQLATGLRFEGPRKSLLCPDEPIRTHNRLTNRPDREPIRLTGSSKATATRDLQELARLGALTVVGGGRSTRYDLTPAT